MLLSTLSIAFLFSAVPTFATSKSSEYDTLGCPAGTKRYATQRQQLAALTDFGDLLYLQKQVAKAENTYVAANFINHAPEVPGDGRELAIKTITPLLNTSTIEIQRRFVGQDADGQSFGVTYFKGISQILGVGVIADIWRMIGTCLVEHWDVATGAVNFTNPKAYF